jgi:hypothetical protein
MATRCIACEQPLVERSVEHLVPQALGATKTSTALYCGSCNRKFGDTLDARLTKDLEFLSTALDVVRDRGAPPSVFVHTQEGKIIRMAAGGIPSTIAPEVEVSLQPDGTKNVTIRVPADKPELHAHMLAKVAKQEKVLASALSIQSGEIRNVSVGQVTAQVALGGEPQHRAIAKIALGFLAHRLGDDIFEALFAGLRNFVLRGGDARSWRRRTHRDELASAHDSSEGIEHRVQLYTRGAETWAYIELFGTFGYDVVLAEGVAERMVPYFWRQNPVTGASSEGDLEAVPPTPERADRPLELQDYARLYAEMHRINLRVAIDLILHEESLRLEGEIGRMDEKLLFERAMRRVAELGEPCQETGVMVRVEGDDVTERIRSIARALTRAATKARTDKSGR